MLSCLLFGAGLHAFNKYPLRRIDIEAGLSQNMVFCICQDSQEFMWFGTQDGLNLYDGNSVKVFRNNGKNGLGNNGILCISEAPDGRLWIGTIMGLYIYDPAKERFSTAGDGKFTSEGKVRNIAFTPDGRCFFTFMDNRVIRFSENGGDVVFTTDPLSTDSRIRSICSDGEGNIWIAGFSMNLVCLTPEGETIEYASPADIMLTKVTSIDSETLLIGTLDHGIMSFDQRTHSFGNVSGMDGDTITFVHDILRDSRRRIWVGAENGLFIYDNGEVTHLTHIPNVQYSLADNSVFSLAEDKEGGIWIGTYFGGVNYYSEYLAQFRKYIPVPGWNKLKGKNISEFSEASDGTIWIGTEDAGLHSFNPRTEEFRSRYVPASNVHAIKELDGQVWVGTYGNGLYILNPETGRSVNIRSSDIGLTQVDDNIFCIERSVGGNTYVGTDAGLFRFDLGRMHVEKIGADKLTSSISDIHQDFSGNIWIATSGSGIFRMDPSDEDPEQVYSKSQYMTCILETSNHDIWFGTDDAGIVRYNHTTKQFEGNYSSRQGLPDDMVYMLLEDASGNIWGSTNHGIFRLSPADGGIIAFNSRSGLACDQYNFRSGLRTKNGTFYFGGVKGFVCFNPDSMLWPAEKSKIVFNRFLVGNKEVDFDDRQSPVSGSITFADKITIRPGQSVFSIGFADLVYPISGAQNYHYRVKGLDDDWVPIGNTRLLSFSDMKPGKYTLEIRPDIFNRPDENLTKSMAIHVLPPWYRTILAYIIYAVLILSAILAIYLFQSERTKRRNRAILDELERQKEKELYDAKFRFFTNITHEIRTPLTLITAPMNDIMEKISSRNPIYDDLSIIQKNSNRLLSLVNELLDFRKVEVGNMLPNFARCDIVSLTQDTLTRFQQRIKAGKLDVRTEFPKELHADIDREIYTKIFSNLLLNACKHAETRIRISLETKAGRFRLRISNDGDRIPRDKAESIFDPFVKLDDDVPGTGIGLTFARTLVSTHGGDIYLDLSGRDTCFAVEMPLHQEKAVKVEENIQVITETFEAEKPVVRNRNTVLIVEDNAELREFLSRKIGEKYRVFTASDGKEAYGILSGEIIDIVITDLMMPGMDGSSLCSAIKEDISTSHIPVIVVTAKSDMNTRMECIRNGADDFIPKPFQTSYLLVRIENILKAKENLIKAFSSNPELSMSSIATSSRDKEFISRLKEVIEENIGNPELDVDELAGAMNMSRATFYRKMKGFTEVSPNEFIRLCRLRKAAELLKSGDTHINEIAYSTGFGSPSYFTRCFSRQFGMTPKEYAAKD